MWEGAAGWSTQLRRGCWVATGLSWWMGCSDPQGSGRGRESINPAKMKLCPGCHNPFASSKLYKLFAVFFAFVWWLIWYSWDPICRDVAFEFLCSPEVICGNTGKDVLFLQNKRTPAATRKPNQKMHKQTTKQENQIINQGLATCGPRAGSGPPCEIVRPETYQLVITRIRSAVSYWVSNCSVSTVWKNCGIVMP